MTVPTQIIKSSPYCASAIANYIRLACSNSDFEMDVSNSSLNLCRQIVRAHAPVLYGDAVKASQIDYWVDYTSDVLQSADFKPIVNAMRVLDNH